VNYRHHFHAGNFADVVKHVILLALIKGMQRKEKGFLYLDTHAGRGLYDLGKAEKGDSLERKPEWPEGVGRLWNLPTCPELVRSYLQLVRRCNTEHGEPVDSATVAFYPGSPWLAQALARPQDRLMLCEKHPEECEILRDELSIAQHATVQQLDGYLGPRACLPPPEKRALVLIDPPFESQDEFSAIISCLQDGLRRMPAATFAVWYPLTERARIDAFFDDLAELRLPPCWTAELCMAGPDAGIRMRGCGLLVINPPWKLDEDVSPLLPWLEINLSQAPGADSRLLWLVPEL